MLRLFLLIIFFILLTVQLATGGPGWGIVFLPLVGYLLVVLAYHAAVAGIKAGKR